MTLNRSVSSFLLSLCIMAALLAVSSLNYASSVVEKDAIVSSSDIAADKELNNSNMVNINTSDAAQIAAVLKGIGLKKAQAIVDWRNANGEFRAIDQLLEVKGIGEKILDDNKDRISL